MLLPLEHAHFGVFGLGAEAMQHHQITPSRFDERVFRALDYVIAESRRYGVRLVLCLVNNLQAYGGKTQYVKWAWEEGVGLSSSNDSFFYDPSIRLLQEIC